MIRGGGRTLRCTARAQGAPARRNSMGAEVSNSRLLCAQRRTCIFRHRSPASAADPSPRAPLSIPWCHLVGAPAGRKHTHSSQPSPRSAQSKFARAQPIFSHGNPLRILSPTTSSTLHPSFEGAAAGRTPSARPSSGELSGASILALLPPRSQVSLNHRGGFEKNDYSTQSV